MVIVATRRGMSAGGEGTRKLPPPEPVPPPPTPPKRGSIGGAAREGGRRPFWGRGRKYLFGDGKGQERPCWTVFTTTTRDCTTEEFTGWEESDGAMAPFIKGGGGQPSKSHPERRRMLIGKGEGLGQNLCENWLPGGRGGVRIGIYWGRVKFIRPSKNRQGRVSYI